MFEICWETYKILSLCFYLSMDVDQPNAENRIICVISPEGCMCCVFYPNKVEMMYVFFFSVVYTFCH